MDREQGTIVVGVDGSESSVRALRWAVEQARLTGKTVEAVRAWQIPGSYTAGGVVMNSDAFAKSAHESLDTAVNQAGGDSAEIRLERRVVEGHPAKVLIDRATEADLLVVGNRGHGGFVGALIGSISQHCIHHASCPVVVVPHEE